MIYNLTVLVMAHSKNGGSRAYIRGRIGSDVYSVGKNGMGEKQQVVRSLAEQVANPRTQGQMFGRMVMSTVMQAVSALTQLIDHSFDGYPKGQPSISQFIRNNYALIKTDAENNPSSGNRFGLNKYQEKGVKVGNYLVSDGNILLPAAVTADSSGFVIGLTAQTLTIGGLKAALGLSADGYLTFVKIGNSTGTNYFRAKLTTTLADSTAISSSNVGTLFTFDGTVTPTVSLSGSDIEIMASLSDISYSSGVIVSEKIEGAWKHNKCQLLGLNGYDFNADAALPTYPRGAEMFLNGGDL